MKEIKNIKEALHWRYTTKFYDRNKKISKEDFAEIEEILQLSPTSTNLQPLYFIVADNDAGKKRIAKGTSGFFSFNESKILDASHVIIFCSKAFVDDKHLEKVLEKETKDGRYANEEFKEQAKVGRKVFLETHRYLMKDEITWHAKQSYITFGAVLLAAAQLGIDATPIEGIDSKILEEEFNLHKKGLIVNSVISLGYRNSVEDFNEKLPKSRLEKKDIIEKI